MSLRIAPAQPHSTAYTHLKAPGAPSAPALHDNLRSGLNPDEFTPVSSHPLEHRLKQWESTQDKLRLEMLRRTYGIAEPVRREMELKIVKEGTWRLITLGGNLPHLHEDILRGKDTSVTWEDIFKAEEQVPLTGIHAEMERKINI